jgi:hypothetical protein
MEGSGVMITIIETDHGTYNVLGIKEGRFFLQGNLTAEELVILADAIKEAQSS